jgi:hypothetical protein
MNLGKLNSTSVEIIRMSQFKFEYLMEKWFRNCTELC